MNCHNTSIRCPTKFEDKPDQVTKTPHLCRELPSHRMAARSVGFLIVLSIAPYCCPDQEGVEVEGAEPGGVFPERICKDGTCYTLRHVSAVFRHTARAPTVITGKDPFLKPHLFPRGAGRSTVLGMQKAAWVGRLWRSWWKYSLLVGENRLSGPQTDEINIGTTPSPSPLSLFLGVLCLMDDSAVAPVRQTGTWCTRDRVIIHGASKRSVSSIENCSAPGSAMRVVSSVYPSILQSSLSRNPLSTRMSQDKPNSSKGPRIFPSNR